MKKKVSSPRTLDSSLGNGYNTRSLIHNTPASPPAFHPASLPCTSQQIGPVSGKFPGLPPGQGCHMLTPMSTSADSRDLRPLPSQIIIPELLQQNPNTCSNLNQGDWPSLPMPSRPSWTGWRQLLRSSNYPPVVPFSYLSLDLIFVIIGLKYICMHVLVCMCSLSRII